MGTFSRQELEDAFASYKARGEEAGRSGDWVAWAEQFTPDAVYIEHHYGRFDGREAIAAWISGCMGEFPGSAMPEFPIGWHVVDEERGWIVCQVFNRMVDPGDGSVHEMDNVTILHYAGDGQWSYEEDVYNPADFERMVRGWLDRRSQLARIPGVTPDDELRSRFGDRFDPEVAELVLSHGGAGATGVPHYLGIRFTELGPGWCTAEVALRPELRNPVGVAHGAVVASLVDHLLGSTVIALVPPRTWPATLEFKLNYLAPAREGKLVARAEVLSISKRTAVVQVECTNEGRTVATALGTIMLAAPRSAPESTPDGKT